MSQKHTALVEDGKKALKNEILLCIAVPQITQKISTQISHLPRAFEALWHLTAPLLLMGLIVDVFDTVPS